MRVRRIYTCECLEISLLWMTYNSASSIMLESPLCHRLMADGQWFMVFAPASSDLADRGWFFCIPVHSLCAAFSFALMV